MDFRYVAVDTQGQTVSGHVSASGEREAARLLQAQDLTLIEIASAVGKGSRVGVRRGRATSQQKAIVVRELATLLRAGVSLAEAVESIGQSHTDSAIGAAFMQVHDRLRNGESFSHAMHESALDWPEYLLQMAAAGEHTGKLAEALQGAAAQMEYQQRLKSEMRNALLYPSVLVISGIAATLLIFVVVVPKFAGILKNSRAQVPDISMWVLSVALFVKAHLLWVLMGGLAAIMAAGAVLANPRARAHLLQAVSHAPLLGPWLIETEVGRWAAMLSTLLENRVPMLKAMELAQDSLQLTALRQKLQRALRDVRGGKKLAEALAGQRILDVTGLNLVRVGERSGELAAMLRALATLHEDAARDRLKRFLTILEPVAILLIGGVIGFIMVSVMLAITSITNIPL